VGNQVCTGQQKLYEFDDEKQWEGELLEKYNIDINEDELEN